MAESDSFREKTAMRKSDQDQQTHPQKVEDTPKRGTADKGVQVNKEDILTAMKSDKGKMPPPPLPQRSSQSGTTTRAEGRVSQTRVYGQASSNQSPSGATAAVGSAPMDHAGETPGQWAQRQHDAIVAGQIWRAQHSHHDGFEELASRRRVSEYLIQDYGKPPICLTSAQDQAPDDGCRHSCGKPGGEHALDCPDLMNQHY